jgi:hypothetical protein
MNLSATQALADSYRGRCDGERFFRNQRGGFLRSGDVDIGVATTSQHAPDPLIIGKQATDVDAPMVRAHAIPIIELDQVRPSQPFEQFPQTSAHIGLPRSGDWFTVPWRR